MKGRFITFEGGEGSGKSTQIRLLAEAMKCGGKDVITTREPGGSEGAEEIRKLLVTGKTDRWDDLTETLLFFAARRNHLTAKIWPAIEQGKIVLCDRFADSTMAYQGYGYGNNPKQQKLIKALYKEIAGDFKPDATILLDIPVEEGLKRSRREDNKEQRFEDKELAFHERLRAAYLKMAKEDPDRFIVIDATQPIMTIHQQIIQGLMNKLIFRKDRTDSKCLKNSCSKSLIR